MREETDFSELMVKKAGIKIGNDRVSVKKE